MASSIHPTAFISPKATIGENVTIGPCVVIDDDVIIGDNCTLDAFASIKQYTRIGIGNKIFSHAMVGGSPQDLKFRGEVTWLEIGDYNVIREFATLHRGTDIGGGLTKIGNNNLLMAYTHIAHDCRLCNHIVLSNNATLAGHVTIDDYAIVGGLSAVHQFVHIGEHAFLGGFSGASQDIPPFMLASGSRATLIGPNVVGLRRMGASTALLAALKQVFRTVWLSGIPRPDALAQIEAEFQDIKEVQILISFIKSSERGVLAVSRNSASE